MFYKYIENLQEKNRPKNRNKKLWKLTFRKEKLMKKIILEILKNYFLKLMYLLI
jgi:hypothetical protein